MPETTPDTWAIVELMGHYRIAGRLSEEEKFGCKMGRVDIPTLEKCACQHASHETPESPNVKCVECLDSGFVKGFITQYFGGASVYKISIVSEEVARHTSRSTSPAPVSPWDFPKAAIAAPVRTHSYEDPDDDEGEDEPDDDRDDEE
jgi:hypothetical protein